MNSTLILYCDATKTKKAASYGWIAFYSGQSIAHDAGWLDRMSSVSAEVSAVIRALDWLTTTQLVHPQKTIVRTDCLSVIDFLSHTYPARDKELATLITQLRKSISATTAIVEWIPRGRNRHADRMSRSIWKTAYPDQYTRWMRKHGVRP